MARVRLDNVDKTYGSDVYAVKKLTLECPEGAFLALLGPSGCGKTSTMRMIAGLERASSGTIRLNDVVVNDLSPRERNVSMAFERYGLYPHQTVFQNIAYPLRLQHLSTNDILRRVAAVVETLQLLDVVDSFPSALSLGQQQRVSLARALVKRPEVFLLDEPLSHLELELRSTMRDELKRLHKELGHTTIYVTHDQSEAMALADFIAVMDRGVLQQVGKPEEIFNAPVNTFVASFVGNIPTNLIELTVSRRDDIVELVQRGKLRLPIPLRYQRSVSAGLPESVLLGVRPHSLQVVPEDDSAGILPAKVLIVEPLGDVVLVTADVDGATLRVETAERNLQPGQHIRIAVDMESALLFDAGTKCAIAA